MDSNNDWVGLRAVGRDPHTGQTVHVRFTPSELPVLTSHPAYKKAAIRAAGRALVTMGRSYLGGHLEVRWDLPTVSGSAMAVSEYLAATWAVEHALLAAGRRRPPDRN
ncbi:hypothetical protein [Allorhizocola rhizosphaerae]|uniref:hypothetical protein n=1 Tax=Allorhizocola rhizosphaerae TaxID=1872709 RepID=UPI0013C2A062|nr:hypothetical protein [Allorhizocola rhizosphaerae]